MNIQNYYLSLFKNKMKSIRIPNPNSLNLDYFYKDTYGRLYIYFEELIEEVWQDRNFHFELDGISPLLNNTTFSCKNGKRNLTLLMTKAKVAYLL